MTTKIVSKSNKNDKSDSVSLNSYDMRLQNNLSKNVRMKTMKGSRDQVDNIIDTPFSKNSLGRNCVSLENIGGVIVTDDGFSGYPPAYPAYFYYQHPYQQFTQPFSNGYQNHHSSAYFNNSSSIGNQSQDDFRKYRDVAL
jgi:hypothetical protein